jgi:hypothetical protein
MKSKFALLVVGVVMSIASVAASVSSVIVTSASEHVFKVHYNANEAGKVKISILNGKDQLVFSEVLLNTGSFTRPYNFSELAEGEYTILVEGNGVKQAEKVNYSIAKVTSFAMVTEIANQANKYLLNVSNKGTQNVTVRIYSNDGTLLHVQTLEVTENAGIIYDLNKVKTNDSTITFEISLDGGNVQTIHI